MPISFSREKHRKAVFGLYFLHGICFATWASRIPSLQQKLHLTDSQLGFVLFAIPIGDLITIPFSSWITSKKGSTKLVAYAMISYALVLFFLGQIDTLSALVFGLAFFGMTSNLVNICVNTQSVLVQKMYTHSIIASFHGVWSVAGFGGALLGAWLLSFGLSIEHHFLFISVLIVLGSLFVSSYLAPDKGFEKPQKVFFTWPDRSMLILGFLACCCMACEGAMFDWSGIYFEKIVRVEENKIGLGYVIFVGTMALGRFLSDKFISRFGLLSTLRVSGLLISLGLAIAIIWPFLITATVGFSLVGFGVSSVVPIVFGEAGKSKHIPPPIALGMVTTIGFIGFLLGPPMIGTVAGWTSLRVSFSIIAIMGACVGILGKYVPNSKV